MFMKMTIANNIKTSLPQNTNALEYLKAVEDRFKSADKSLAGTFMAELTTMKYDGSYGVQEHILNMSDKAAKLATLGMKVDESFLVQFILNSLPTQFGPSKLHYNTNKDMCSLNELTNMCVQEKVRLRGEGRHTALAVTQVAMKKKGKAKKYPPKKASGPGEIKPVKSAECNQTCGTAARGNMNRVPNPFGFSPGCGIPLKCTGTGQIKIGTFQVQNITSDSILIDFPAKCGRTVRQTEQLFGPNYALTRQNGLLLINCTSQLKGCIIPTAMVETRYGSLDCGFRSDNVSCYSRTDAGSGFISYDSLTRSGCGKVYSSIAEVDVGGDDDAGRNSTVSLQFQAAELGWWLGGGCNCSAEAECTNVTVPGGGSGYRCQCREGFAGDGFGGGGGRCQKGESTVLNFCFIPEKIVL
ncbi:hypothetical protein RHSIM_RhsimUnG0047800 [Rhododendron simsii]|uniref:Uncharacterized protein n=1 Tax=Rhododendron simsii TaxID=118357 RepID=A0A834FWF3_RHOSS|nr:hypothetical protein RHSIM_RhsimUnG0047800 [Rhododendron simsii]